MATTPEQYYSDSSNYGNYQYVSLNDMVTNFILNYVGDDKILNNVPRHNILFHLKRGLAELSYDALKEVKVLALDVSEDLTFVLPQDYVNYVRISWLDENGKFRPMITNSDSNVAVEYLQDSSYDIVFDVDGYPTESDVDEIDISNTSYSTDYTSYTCDEEYSNSAVFNLDASKANINGIFIIDKRSGVIKFSSNISEKKVILEYISDGLEYSSSDDVKVNKLAEQSMYDYASWALLDGKLGIQEYVIRRAKKKYVASRRATKSRIGGFRYNELLQTLRGQGKWLK